MSVRVAKVRDTINLNNNTEMPAIGLGTFKIKEEEDIMRTVDEALKTGYRLFDTAALYRNEKHLGKAFRTLLPMYGLEREDLFVTSKLNPNEMCSKRTVKNAYDNIINSLEIEYLDLFLVNFPGQPKLHASSPRHKVFRNIAWAALTDLYDDNLVNAIGVSNFTVDHLNEIITDKRFVVPAINQVEWHPYFHDDCLHKLCEQNDIWVQGYSPLGGWKSKGVVLQDPTVRAIALELEVTPAQVLLTWSSQCRVASIPKSSNPAHIQENFMLNVN